MRSKSKRHKQPYIRIQPSLESATLNKKAAHLLSSQGAGYVALIKSPDGSICVKPLPLPEETFSVVRLTGGGRLRCGYRISFDAERTAYNKPAQHRCEWDDKEGVLRILPAEK